ncbi:MAG: class I SAM-dependent methyltransferase [Smithella sp.]|jgi:2-polyprenyl-3-methyl-5-hydroxy-6-metoxy-1,4-benzoquinol methylase
MDSRGCNYCGLNKDEILLQSESYQLVTCKGCGLTRTIPVPETKYDEQVDYFENYLNNEKLFRSFFKQFIKFIRQHIPYGKLLEIGSSVGFLLEEAIKYGYQVEGIELNKKAVEYCSNKGITINNCYLKECLFQNGKFDIVVMSHVLEHITDLNDFLKEIARILSPNGFIVLSQPTYVGLIAKLLRNNWYGWAPKDHVWHFTPENISSVLRQNGFEVKAIERNTMYYPFGFKIKTLIIAFVARLSGLIGQGDQFYVIAQKING